VSREAPFEAFARLRADPAVERVLVGHRERRQVVGAELEFEVAARRQLDGVVEQFRQVGEGLRHFGGRLQVLLGRVFARAFRIGEHAAGVDAHARFVRFEVFAFEEAHVVAGDDGQREPAAEVERAGEERLLVVAADARGFQIQAIGKPFAPPLRAFERSVAATGEQQAADVAVLSRYRNEALVAFVEPRRIDEGDIAVAVLGERARHEFRQREIAVAVLAQHGQALRALAVVAVGEPEIAAGYRLDAGAFSGLVELDQREQVALVGQRHCRHVRARASADEIADADRRVDQRIFAVDVEVNEGRSHGAREPSRHGSRRGDAGQALTARAQGWFSASRSNRSVAAACSGPRRETRSADG
jgi:hypothetical protein